MGVVYEAFDEKEGTRVALKTLRHFSGDALLRFKREFRALQDLDHPSLVSFGELISEDGQWFFTMELVEGVDFLHYVRVRDEAPTIPEVGSVRKVRPPSCRASRLHKESPNPTPGAVSADSSALLLNGRIRPDWYRRGMPGP